MTLELLLSAACIFGNNEGCQKLAEGYYHYEHLDEITKNIERKYPAFVFATSVVGSISNKKATIPVYGHIYLGADFAGQNQRGIIIGYNKSF